MPHGPGSALRGTPEGGGRWTGSVPASRLCGLVAAQRGGCSAFGFSIDYSEALCSGTLPAIARTADSRRFAGASDFEASASLTPSSPAIWLIDRVSGSDSFASEHKSVCELEAAISETAVAGFTLRLHAEDAAWFAQTQMIRLMDWAMAKQQPGTYTKAQSAHDFCGGLLE